MKKLGGEYKKDSVSSRVQRNLPHSTQVVKDGEQYWVVDQETGDHYGPYSTFDAASRGHQEYPIHRIDLPAPAKGKIRTEGQTFYDLATGAVAAGAVGAATGDDKKKKPMTKREWFEQKKRGNK